MDFDFTNGPNELGCGSQCSNIVVHDCLSYEGQSGSAIWSTVSSACSVPFSLIGAHLYLYQLDRSTFRKAVHAREVHACLAHMQVRC